METFTHFILRTKKIHSIRGVHAVVHVENMWNSVFREATVCHSVENMIRRVAPRQFSSPQKKHQSMGRACQKENHQEFFTHKNLEN